jgi:16S rRNA processing protein RimM
MRFIEIGRIVRAHGIRGRMKAVHFLDDAAFPERVEALYVSAPDREPRSYRVRSIERRGGGLLLEFDGVTDRDAAAALAGRFLCLPEDEAPPLEADEYYWRDLLDMAVRTEAGEELGRITAIFPTGSNDVYVCTGPEREILLPAVAEVVREVDCAGKVMVVRLPEGL